MVDYPLVDRDVYHECLPSTRLSLHAIFYIFALTTLIDAPPSLQGIDCVKQRGNQKVSEDTGWAYVTEGGEVGDNLLRLERVGARYCALAHACARIRERKG